MNAVTTPQSRAMQICGWPVLSGSGVLSCAIIHGQGGFYMVSSFDSTVTSGYGSAMGQHL